MTGTTSSAVRTGRLVGVDVARGLALVGMMAIHVIPAENKDGTISWSELVFGGRSAALFATLAGVSLGLAYARSGRLTGPRLRQATAALWVRALLIGLMGLVLGYFDSGVAVILAYYSVLFVLAAPLLGVGNRALTAVAAVCATVMPVLVWLAVALLPGRDPANPTLAWLQRPLKLGGELLLTGYYPALVFMAYLAAGLLVARVGLRGARAAVRLVAAGAVLWLGGAALSRVLLAAGGADAIRASDPRFAGIDLADLIRRGGYGHVPNDTAWWLVSDGPHTSTPFDVAVTLGSSLVVLGLMLLLAPRAGRLLAPVAGAGSMTLTLYSLHVALLGTTWTDGLDPRVSWLLQVAAVLLIGWVWRARIGRGPLEGIVHGASAGAARAVS